MIDLVLAGRRDAARAGAVTEKSAEPAPLADLALRDLDGRPITGSGLAGRAVLVEFWATWCPPCRGTLAWLHEVQQRYGDRVAIVTVAVESDSARVRAVASAMRAPFAWTLGSPEVARRFGDVSAVPTLFLFDRAGRPAGAYFGAPPGLHRNAEAKLATLLETPAPGD